MQVKELLKTEPSQHTQHMTSRHVLYTNNIFHIKKKFTIPTQPALKKDMQEPNLHHHPKPFPEFSEHVGTLHKNRRLLRRGVWGLPLNLDTLTTHKAANLPRKKSKPQRTIN